MSATCAHCHGELPPYPGVGRRRRFCSDLCGDTYRKTAKRPRGETLAAVEALVDHLATVSGHEHGYSVSSAPGEPTRFGTRDPNTGLTLRIVIHQDGSASHEWVRDEDEDEDVLHRAVQRDDGWWEAQYRTSLGGAWQTFPNLFSARIGRAETQSAAWVAQRMAALAEARR